MKSYLNSFQHYLLTERGYATATITAYISDISQFITALKKKPITASSVDQYLASLSKPIAKPTSKPTSKTAKATTIIRKQSVLTQFLSYLFHNGIISFQYVPEHHIRRPLRMPTPLSRADITQLLKSPNNKVDRFYLRDKLILQWLYGYGVRASELVGVTVSQCGSAFIELIGKGNKTRRIARHQHEQTVCDQYYSTLRQTGLKNRPQTPCLFISNYGKPLTRFGLYAIVKKYARRCQLTGVFPHQFRHSFATHLLEEGADINAVQSLMGHASIQTTQGYMQISDRHKRTIFERTHPRS
jgi:integrase/recombinase XerD